MNLMTLAIVIVQLQSETYFWWLENEYNQVYARSRMIGPKEEVSAEASQIAQALDLPIYVSER